MSPALGDDSLNGTVPTVDWPMVPLEKVLRHRKEFVVINDLELYMRCRVQLHAQGIVLRDKLPGSEIKTKSQQLCRSGEFLVAEIDAKVGGFGIVPEELDSAIVSSHYFLFEIDSELLDSRFLDYFIRTPAFREQVSAQGSTNYAAIRPRDVLGYTMTLPPLSEQKRLVKRVDTLAAKINEARSLNNLAVNEWPRILRNVRNTCFNSIKLRTTSRLLGTVADCRLGKMLSSASKTGSCPAPYLRNANIQMDSFDVSSIYEMDFTESERDTFRLESGDLLINEGGYGVGRCAVWDARIQPCFFQKSLHRVRVDPTLILPRFLLHHLIWANEQGHFANITMTTTFQHLTGVRLSRYGVLIPPIDQQQAIVDYLDRLHSLTKQAVAEKEIIRKELSAFLPSVLNSAFSGNL